jgi:thrombospondin type 3 repeat protein
VLSQPVGVFFGRSQATCSILDDDDDELDHFVWSTVPSPQFVDVPFSATLTARDGLDRTATNFNGAATVRAVADSREAVVGTGTNAWEFPLATFFHDARTQVIYLPEEIGGPGKINGLALQIITVPSQALTNWTIRIKHSSMRSYVQAAWEADGWTTVFQNDESVQSSGWVTFLFPAPFDYDGTSSLLVDFSFDNSTYSANGMTRFTTTETRRSVFFQTDSAFGDPLDWTGTTPPPLMLPRVPNVRFLMETPVAIVPSGPVQLVQGIWTGEVSVREPGANIFLRASDSAGHIANGNPFAVESSTDADGDGLPDAWQRRLLPPNASGPADDADGDGINNLAEFQAGTDPINSASVTKIVSVQTRGADIVIRFTSVAGKRYRLERTRDLTSGAWETVAEQLPGNGGSLEVTDRGEHLDGSGFYRVVLTR